jgi:hypothetical protein
MQTAIFLAVADAMILKISGVIVRMFAALAFFCEPFNAL